MFETKSDRVVVDIWSDIMCPFCYMGDAALGLAMDQFDHPVEVRYHSYQLMPDLPESEPSDLAELLESRRGFPREQADAMNAQITERAAQVGLTYNMDRTQTVNTRAAHRLSHLAQERGLQREMMQRLFAAYFTDGLNIGDFDQLADLAVEVGLDRDEALEALQSDAFADEVDTDIAAAQQLGITGVPFFVLDGALAVSGAQPVETFVQALNQAWAAHRPA